MATKPNCQSSSQRIEESSTGKIDLRIFSTYRKRGRKSDRILWADFGAGPALDAFRKTGSPWIFSDSSHGTGFLAFQTFIAIFIDPALEKSKR